MEDVMRLVSTGDCVKIWDTVSMATLEQFNPHSSSHPIAQACWSSNNQYLVSASSIGDKLVVSSLKLSPVPVVELAEGKKQTRVCLSSSSQFVVSGGLDHCVHIWDLKTKRLHRSLEDHKEEVTCVSFNANDSHVASGSSSGDLILHSLITNVSSKPFGHGSNQPIHDLRLSMLRRSLLGSVSDSGTVVLWDSNTQKEIHVFESAHKAPGSGLSFSPASELLVVSVGLDKKIVCYDTASKIVVRSIRVDSPLTSVDFTLDGTGLVVGSTQGKIYQYDLRNSSAPTRVTAAHKTSVTSLRFQSVLYVCSQSSKTSSSKVGSSKKSSSKLCVVCPVGGAARDSISREAEGQQTPQSLPVIEKFNNIGRNSLDIFSPISQGVTMMELQQIQTCFLDLHSGSNSFRKTPLGTPVGSSLVGTPLMASAGRYNPLHTTFMTPPPIKEEELTHNASDPKDYCKALVINSFNCNYCVFLYSVIVIWFVGPALSAAMSSTLTQNIAETASQNGAPFTSLQMHFIQNMIHETLEDFRDSCHKDIINLQVEMVRQFCIQLNEIHSLIENYSVNEALVEEVQKLREENQKLRANY
uniref:Uncharacterized protein n=1 Tax=Periophthalmus magnuspinnatus TaxID=409849 RepID=A0A3B4A2R5_9GOBI